MTTETQEDPFALLEETAKRMHEEEHALHQMETARTKVLMGRDPKSAFFTVLILDLKPVADWSVPTFATDGEHIFYNPQYCSSLSIPEVMGCNAHEGLHVGKGDLARLLDADPTLRQIALDLALNPLLIEAGFTLPTGCLIPGRKLMEVPNSGLPPGVATKIGTLPPYLLAEEYYQLLLDPPQPQDGDDTRLDGGFLPGSSGQGQEGEDEGEGGGQGTPDPSAEEEGEGQGTGQGKPASQPDPGGCGSVGTASKDPAGIQEAKALSEVKLFQAEEVSRSWGELPPGLARLCKQAREPKVDCWAVLQEFVTRHASSEYRWTPPNRRFVHSGLYLPSQREETLGRIIVAVDTSGSIDEETLATFAGHLEGIISMYPDVVLTILYHDSEVQKIQEWSPQDGPLKLEPVGGGGTDHRPVFRWIEDHAEDHEEPVACVVLLTDLWSIFPRQGPDIPCLWGVIDNDANAPFGQTLHIKEEKK